MPTQTIDKAQTSQPLFNLPSIPRKEGRLYAITFDMDIESLKIHYGDPYNNAYAEIRKILMRQGFAWQQGSVYFGGENINAVTCVLAAIELSRSLPWFSASVRDIRMLRVQRPHAGGATGCAGGLN